MVTSPAGSFQGYSFVEYLRRNKGGIKTLIGIASGYLSFRYGMAGDSALLLGTLTKFALDACDYYLTEQTA